LNDLMLYLDTQTVIGDTVNLAVIRDGKESVVPVILEERPPMVTVQILGEMW